MVAPTSFDILFEDESFIAINKPYGILVHRTKISEDTRFVLQILRDQIGQHVYPVHRLDRATSGVLIFGKNKVAAGQLSEQFRERSIEKKYLAIVRGYVEPQATIDYPITGESGKHPQEAITHYTRLAQTEMDIAVRRYPTSRYSYVSIQLETGRWRQIRRHFSHLRHPIIGDKKHGDINHNKFFASEWGIDRMLLHASQLHFSHPNHNISIKIEAPLGPFFEKAKTKLGFK